MEKKLASEEAVTRNYNDMGDDIQLLYFTGISIFATRLFGVGQCNGFGHYDFFLLLCFCGKAKQQRNSNYNSFFHLGVIV